jgi:hypothetical protein
MDFLRALAELTEKLDQASVRYALIGGFGMAMRGVQRATLDLDFVLALDRAECIELQAGLSVPVAAVEDIIGLKVQAMSNDVSRVEQDWLDIRLLVRSARRSGQRLDWQLIGDYFALFDKRDLLDALKENS